MPDPCILVTGGAGFIGCALSRHLIHDSLPMVAVDSLLEQVHPRGEPPEALPTEVVLHRADIRDPATWMALLDRFRPDTVIHLAAETGTAQSLTEASRHASVNVTGTTEMLDALARAGVHPRRVLLASSRAVYGEGLWESADGRRFYPGPRTRAMLSAGRWVPQGPDGRSARPLPHAAGEVCPRPTSVYGATKLAQEHVLGAWCAAFDVPLTVLRLQNVYGPGQSPTNPYTGIINIFHRRARAGLPIEVYEDGAIERDFVFIDDVVAAFGAALGRESRESLTLDVGQGQATTILEAATVISSLHGAPQPVICGKFREGDVRAAVADVGPLRLELGLQARTDFATGARAVGEWLVAAGHA